MNGQFVISLDFEKYWGIFDSKSLQDYEGNLKEVDAVIEGLIKLSDAYGVKLTFATVGFLFYDSKAELKKSFPKNTPKYHTTKHDPYGLIDHIPVDANSTSVYFALDSIRKIKASKNHEIGTHTYCHYYCLEEGQTAKEFEADLQMAIEAGNKESIVVKSIVFPRNQINSHYLEICKDHGIIAYRGYENHTIYKPKPYKDSKKKRHRAQRIFDAYLNITGNHTYDLNTLDNNGIVNIPSSYFLRPYSKKLGLFEPLKLRRIQKGMLKAAQQKQLYHLWFHPHNFGKDMDQNFKNFENILRTYKRFNEAYAFESNTMGTLAKDLIKKS